MRRTIALTLLAGILVAAPALAQTAIELKKELLPQMKKAQADGKDLGEGQQFYNEGDKALKDGMQDEAAEAFKKAKAAMPK
jgi:outer membrane protein assembly factor BamD (BamD/ComL family)